MIAKILFEQGDIVSASLVKYCINIGRAEFAIFFLSLFFYALHVMYPICLHGALHKSMQVLGLVGRASRESGLTFVAIYIYVTKY